MTRRIRIIWVPRREWFIGSSRLQQIRWWQFGPIQIVYEGKPWGDRNQDSERRDAMNDPVVIEGVVYDPTLDSHARGIRTDDGEHVYIEELLREGERVRVTIEVLEPKSESKGDS